ncbi:type 4a pilus biogenesis protein PilO [Candidatus Omnitrophota bacterium]
MKVLKQLVHKFLSRLSQREKLVFYGAIFFISLTLLDRFLIHPIFSKMEELDKEIREKESGIKKSLHILAHKDRIVAERKKYSSFSSSLKPGEEEMTSLLKEIEKLANKSSVYLIDMKPAGLKKAGSSEKYFINLNCEAQMGQLASFIYDLESSSKLFSVERYRIGPKSKESSVAKCSMYISKIVMQ